MSRPWPSWGLAVAVGLSAAECGLVLRNLLRGFGAGGVLHLILPMLALYALLGMALDHLAWRLRPGWGAWGRAGLPLGVAWGLGVASGQLLFSLTLVLVAAGLWAWLAHQRRGRWLALAAAVGAFWCTLPDPGLQRPALAPTWAPGPSIAVVVLDTARKDRFGAYGYPRPTTPHFDALAARGVRFDAAWSTAHWSLPAHASMWTGLLPEEHGAHSLNVRMATEPELLAERLLAAGYDTAGFTANPFAGSGVHMDQGFATFADHWRRFTVGEVLLGYRVRNGLFATDRDKGGQDILADVRAWLGAREPARPFFLFVNFMEAHGPYQEVPRVHRDRFSSATPREQERAGEAGHMAQLFDIPVPARWSATNLDMLDASTAAADALLGELLALLPPDTTLLVLSDHGDLVEEHGQCGHNAGLWEPIVAVPLVMAGPGLPGGLRVATPASIADVAPTVLALAGRPVPPGLFGRDLRTLQGERVVIAEQQRAVYTTSGWRSRHPLRDNEVHLSARAAATDGRVKRVLHADGRDWSFDLRTDPGELQPGEGALTGLELRLPEGP